MNLNRLKNTLLITLILTCVIQVGILWDFNAHGLPFNFFKAFQNWKVSASAPVKKMQAELFTPKRIIVSTGAYQSNWIINKEGDSQSAFKELWEDAKIYIGNIIADENIESSKVIDEKWSDIVQRKSISIEFDTPMSQDMIGYFISKKVKNNSGAAIVKLVIAPWDSDNSYNSTVVYSLDSNSRVYKYTISMSDKNLKRGYYDSKIEELTKQQEQGTIRNYMVFSETKNKVSYPIRQDMMVSLYGSKYDKLGLINVTIPDNYKVTQGESLLDVEKKFEDILGKDQYSYDLFTDTNGTVTMKNQENIYRLYTNGILEYKRTGSIPGEKGAKDQAFINSMAFVEKLGLVPGNVQVYLSGIEELRDRYRFTFDYKIANLPIYFDVGLPGKSEDRITNSIVIESSSTDTLSCWWIIRDIEPQKDKKQYNVNFVDVLDSAFEQNANIKQLKDFSVQDVLTGYRLTGDGTGSKIEPQGLIIGGNNSIYSVKLKIRQ
jgi:hypothetical protein